MFFLRLRGLSLNHMSTRIKKAANARPRRTRAELQSINPVIITGQKQLCQWRTCSKSVRMRSASAAEQQVGSWSRIRRDRWLLVSRRQEEATVSINIQETDHRYLAATGGASALYSLGSLGNLASAPPRPLLPNCGRRPQIKVSSFHTGVKSGFGTRASHGR